MLVAEKWGGLDQYVGGILRTASKTLNQTSPHAPADETRAFACAPDKAAIFPGTEYAATT